MRSRFLGITSDGDGNLAIALLFVLWLIAAAAGAYFLRPRRGHSRASARRDALALRIRSIFNAPDKAEAERLLRQALDAWKSGAPKLAQWAKDNLPDGFTAFDFPDSQRTRLRTTNGLERINREIKRRTRVASIFPNTASCLRLVSALLAERDEEWMTGNIYLNMKD